MSWAVWITGPPGSGKSSLARAAADELRSTGALVRALELDEIRKTLTPSPTSSEGEGDVVYRALGFMAALLTEAGVPVIIDATAHRRIWRDLARAAIPRFAEVQLRCPLEVCRERERTREAGHAPRGIYDRAGRPGATVPGVDLPYEPALAPELVIDTARENVREGAARITALCRQLSGSAPAVEARDRSTAAAIWITGRPGSGKTTLAGHVAEALATRGHRVAMLNLGALRRFLLPHVEGSEAEQEIAHRALAHAARLLTEVGVTVIVDATAPRRAWREAARETIPCFGEVQLVCPVEVCLERERAARWSRFAEPGACHGPAASVVPDIVLDYEESLRPELTLDTDAHDVWGAVEQVLWLVRRLRRTAAFHLQ